MEDFEVVAFFCWVESVRLDKVPLENDRKMFWEISVLKEWQGMSVQDVYVMDYLYDVTDFTAHPVLTTWQFVGHPLNEEALDVGLQVRVTTMDWTCINVESH